MAILSPFTFLQWFDNSGSPLANGKIYTYIAGTSTPKSTYTDSTGSTAHTNPIILDSGGRAQIWLDSGAYKFIVQTSAGAVVETIDNILGSQSANVLGFVNTIVDLKALQSGAYSGVYVLGYTTQSDGGEGAFYWDSASTASDDTGTVILPNSAPATGRWKRYITNGKYNPKYFETAAYFFAWCAAQTEHRSIIITHNLDLLTLTYVLNSYIDFNEFHNNAQITNGTITIGKISCLPMHKIFSDTLTVTFAANAARIANLSWFGSGGSALSKLIASFPSGGIDFVDDTEAQAKLRLKYIDTNGTIYDYAIFNPLETEV
jgi:hypothetical protein